MNELQGKTAVITGGTRGIGFAIARAYLDAGASVVIGSRSQKAVDDALQRLGGNAAGNACDVGKLDDVQALAELAVQRFGQIDVWVNNAATDAPFGPTAQTPIRDVEQTLQTNIIGLYYGSVTALRHFVPRGQGKLINMLGRGDTGPAKYQSAYTTSKGWVLEFTKVLAKEYQDSGIGIYAFNPGLVKTDLLTRVTAIEGYEGRLKPLQTIINLWATEPEEPAARAVWLASAATDGRTGLVVNEASRSRLLALTFRALMKKLRRQSDWTPLTIQTIPPEQ